MQTVITIMPKVDAEALLAPYVDRLRACVQAAWCRWQAAAIGAADAGASAIALRSRARANVMYDLIRDEVERVFADDPTVSKYERFGVLWLNIQGKVVVRFKLLDKDRHAHNLATNRQRELSAQRELPDMPEEALRLTAGYQLDRSEAGINAILVTCYVGKTEIWWFDTSKLAQQPQLFPDVVPTPEDAPRPTVRRKQRDAAEKPEQKANDGN